MARFKKRERVSTEIDPEKNYTKTDLEDIADQLLRDDARSELCRECGEHGEKTGVTAKIPSGLTNPHGEALMVVLPEYCCENDHAWFEGEGEARGIGGDNPILFEEHFQSRKRREIYTSIGTPDPSIVAGIYNRTHPQGRKVNSEEQRKRNGASFFR